MRNLIYRLFSISLALGILQISCSVPNLEVPECAQSRVAVKQFYSFHFGNDMRPSPENLKQREKFLTGDLIKTLSASNETAVDYFTATSDYPKAFRIGTCTIAAPGKADLQIVLFWRDDNRSEQKEVIVQTIRQNDTWLIDKVLSK